MIKVGIIGATGYAGGELVRILMGHKEAEIVWYGSRSYIDQKYADVYRNMFQIVDAKCMDDNMEELADAVDVIFTATPQGLCASLVNDEILSKVKIIDLSADFRLKNVDIYEKWESIEIYNTKENTHTVLYGPNGEPRFKSIKGEGFPTGIMGFSDTDRHSPVTMPRCATLCCRIISMTVESVTTHSSE